MPTTHSAVRDMLNAARSYDTACRVDFIVRNVCADYEASAGAPPSSRETFRRAVNRAHDAMVRGGVDPDTSRAELWRRAADEIDAAWGEDWS